MMGVSKECLRRRDKTMSACWENEYNVVTGSTSLPYDAFERMTISRVIAMKEVCKGWHRLRLEATKSNLRGSRDNTSPDPNRGMCPYYDAC